MLCRMAKDLETGVDMDSAASTPTFMTNKALYL